MKNTIRSYPNGIIFFGWLLKADDSRRGLEFIRTPRGGEP